MANEKPQNFQNHARQVPVFAAGQIILMVSFVGQTRRTSPRHFVSIGNGRARGSGADRALR